MLKDLLEKLKGRKTEEGVAPEDKKKQLQLVVLVLVAVAGYAGYKIYKERAEFNSFKPHNTVVVRRASAPSHHPVGKKVSEEKEEENVAKGENPKRPSVNRSSAVRASAKQSGRLEPSKVSPERSALVRTTASVKEQAKKPKPVTDVFTGKDIKISELEREKKIKELQSQILELEVKMAEKKRKLAELQGKVEKKDQNSKLEAEIKALRLELERQKRAKYPAVAVEPLNVRVISVICSDSTCKAVVREKGAEFVVKKGDMLPDGSLVVAVKEDGVSFSRGGRIFFKPVELIVPVKVNTARMPSARLSKPPVPKGVEKPIFPWR